MYFLFPFFFPLFNCILFQLHTVRLVYRILESAPTPRASQLRVPLTTKLSLSTCTLIGLLTLLLHDAKHFQYECAEACNPEMPARAFSTTPSPASRQHSPYLRPSCLSHQHPKPPCLWGGETEACALTPGLATLWISYFATKPLCHRGPWAADKANSPDPITAHVFFWSHPLSTCFLL